MLPLHNCTFPPEAYCLPYLTSLVVCILSRCRYGEFGLGGGTSQYCDKLAKTPAEVRHSRWLPLFHASRHS